MATLKAIKAAAAKYYVGGLLSVGADSKTVKGEKMGYLTGVMYMMPNDMLCPASKAAGCREACLVSAGRAAFTQSIGKARAARTDLFERNKPLFFALLVKEIEGLVKKADKQGLIPVVRLNGTSDIDWYTLDTGNGQNIFDRFNAVQFYDYSKRVKYALKSKEQKNHNVTLSYSEARSSYAASIVSGMDKGFNAAVVFNGALPEMFLGRKVVNGDESDLRFLDDSGVVVGLKAKGKAKKDNSGFVIIARG